MSEADVDLLQAGNAAAGNLGDRIGNAERDLRQDRELVSGIGAIHVQGRVRLGITELLGLGQGVLVADALLAHVREDVIAGAVKDALNRYNLIGRQPLRQGGDDRNAAADAGLEANGLVVFTGHVENLGSVRGQDLLRLP